jgi:hypothetical protein
LIRQKDPNVPDQVATNAAQPSTGTAAATPAWSPGRLSAVVEAAYIIQLARR